MQLLYKLATAAGAQITFGATVIAVTPGDSSPSVTLASGSTFTADLVVAADGANSFVRNSLFGQQELPKPSKISSLATTIQAGTWEGVPEFKPLNEINGVRYYETLRSSAFINASVAVVVWPCHRSSMLGYAYCSLVETPRLLIFVLVEQLIPRWVLLAQWRTPLIWRRSHRNPGL